MRFLLEKVDEQNKTYKGWGRLSERRDANDELIEPELGAGQKIVTSLSGWTRLPADKSKQDQISDYLDTLNESVQLDLLPYVANITTALNMGKESLAQAALRRLESSETFEKNLVNPILDIMAS